MSDDPVWAKMVAQLAVGWKRDKCHDRDFRTQVIYETIEKYVEVRCSETGENETKVVAEAADTFTCSEETVWRALREIRKMRATVTKGNSRQ